jgi:putative inorganic carbon (HCO3(-)) transporter
VLTKPPSRLRSHAAAGAPALLPERSKTAYQIILVFSFLYFFTPPGIVPGLGALHLARITGGLALLALMVEAREAHTWKLPFEVKVLLALFAWLILCIPFAYWRMGSLSVVLLLFSKAVIITLTLVLTVSRVSELRRLIFVQAFGVTLMAGVSLIINNRVEGRLAGIGGGLLGNSNDLALIIAINWPLCLLFLLRTRKWTARVFWVCGLLVMIYAVMATYSRTGFLTLSLAILLSVWEFVVRGKKLYLLPMILLCLLIGVIAVPADYTTRLATIFGSFHQGDRDNGSAEARKGLLVRSLQMTATHPLFGVGPGNFETLTGDWHVTHNTYTELSSECGIPALFLFLLLLWTGFRNLRSRRNNSTSADEELRLYFPALRIALIVYVLGAFFSSTAYQLLPYYLISYTTLLRKLASGPSPVEGRYRYRLSGEKYLATT